MSRDQFKGALKELADKVQEDFGRLISSLSVAASHYWQRRRSEVGSGYRLCRMNSHCGDQP
jgi:hypothetical protein